MITIVPKPYTNIGILAKDIPSGTVFRGRIDGQLNRSLYIKAGTSCVMSLFDVRLFWDAVTNLSWNLYINQYEPVDVEIHIK
jgi:hypothetical protein